MMNTTSSPVPAHFISAKEASRRFGYSSDYITRLARQQKISGKVIGRQWFVSPNSLEKFRQNADSHKKERIVELSIARRMERVKSQAVVEVERVGRAGSDFIDQVRAGVQALLAVMLGGTAAFLFTLPESSLSGAIAGTYQASVHELELTSYGMHELVTTWQENTTQYAAALFAGAFRVPATAPAPAPATAATGAVIVPEQQASTDPAHDIEAQFSDPVEVIFDDGNPNAGVIVPVFGDRTDGYRFLLVPIEPHPD